jgi:hypothetical protein
VSARRRDEELHDGSRTFIPPYEPGTDVAGCLTAFAAKLTDLNRRHLLAGADGDIQTRDPRDIVQHVEALASGMRASGEVPSGDLVDALGAQCVALWLSVARSEDVRVDTGDAA